jgi:integrase
MSVKIREKRGKLYLDIYQSGKRTWESLHLALTKDKEQNRELMRLADICRSQRESQLLAGAWNIQDPVAGKIKLVAYLEKFAEAYSGKGIVKSCIYQIKKYGNSETVLLSQITPRWFESFQKYLLNEAGISQTTAANYSKILRVALKKAVAANIITRNPADEIERIRETEADLVFLNIDELQRLADTKIDGGNAEIRRAFLFACYTGLRISDLETITWGQLETNPMQIVKRQIKNRMPVYVPLSESAKKLIGERGDHGPDEKVFELSNKKVSGNIALKRWAKDAGINKKTSWHTARRTFATLALESHVDIYTIAKLLGHSSITQVAKYAKVTNRLRRNAVAALPEIKLDDD